MAKPRVYDISKQLDVSNKDVLEAARSLGITLKSHASSLSDEQAQRIREKFDPSLAVPEASEKEAVEIKEVVTVFKTEAGQEVVERRKGGLIVRRTKKLPEPTQEPTQERIEEPAAGEPAETLPTPQPDTAEQPQPAVAQEVEGVPPAATPGEVLAESPVQEPELEPEEPGLPVPAELLQIDQASEADKKDGAAKKKKKSVKPKVEPGVDEDSLEQLKRAFKAKIPVRKREYLVSDKRPRPRGGRGPFDRPQAQRPSAAREDADSVFRAAPEALGKTDKRSIKIGETITVAELAKRMGVKAKAIIRQLMLLGTPVTINQSIDHVTAALVAEEMGFSVTVDYFEESEILERHNAAEAGEELPRPPVVTVMGHVDHGKTSLLDAIRQTNVVEKEAGGITQHIGAYSVDVDGRTIAFVDTPGHEAFTAMRARGAEVTDIVILVVAADDGVMPQTVEAVNHAKAAGVPIIIALNKMDKPEANKEKVIRDLSEIELMPEEWGGDTMLCEVSAKARTGIKELLDTTLLQADVLELKADPNKLAKGTVIEASLDKGRGPVATVIVREGTLKIGDFLLAGMATGKVRALLDDKGNRVQEASPSMPVAVLGLSEVPEAGEVFYVLKDEKVAKDIVQRRGIKEREKIALATGQVPPAQVTPESLIENLKRAEVKELNLIIKADTQGSVEVLRDSIDKIPSEKCEVRVLHAGVGGINETDISLAQASDAMVLGFNVRPDPKAMKMADREGVTLELHKVIYDAVDRVREAMEGKLEPIRKEVILGHADVRDKFHISKVGTIAGCYVTDGNVPRGALVRLVRDGVPVYEGKLSSLKRFKEDAKEVASGYECGIGIENFNDIKVGDMIELYAFEEIRQEL